MGVTAAGRARSPSGLTPEKRPRPGSGPAPEPRPPAAVPRPQPPTAPVARRGAARRERNPPRARPTSDLRLRLPIYDSIESEWFRRGSTSFSGGGRAPGRLVDVARGRGLPRRRRRSCSPVAGQTTSAGLPKRVPSANLVPGSIGARPTGQRAGQAPPAAAGPSRSPEAVRARLTGFQVRGREGRTDAPRPRPVRTRMRTEQEAMAGASPCQWQRKQQIKEGARVSATEHTGA